MVGQAEIHQLREMYSLIEDICYKANFLDDGGKDPLQWNREIVDGLRSSSHEDIGAVIDYLANCGANPVEAREDLLLLTRRLGNAYLPSQNGAPN